MGKAEVIINRRPETVWAFFIKPENWSKWHEQAVLKEVNPGWQEGAIIVWGRGSTSTVRTFIPVKVVEIESPYITTTFNFTALVEEGSTLLQAEFAPRGGATFSDGGLAHQVTLESQLFSLKQCVETETTENQTAKGETIKN